MFSPANVFRYTVFLFCFYQSVTMYIRTYIQVLLDSAVLPILLDIMNTAEFKTRKEAVWAVCNTISGGTPEQVRFKLMFVRTYMYIRTYICTSS